MISGTRPRPATRPRKRRPGARVPKHPRAPIELSHEGIRAAALHLIDQDGLAAFSTRKLGRVLGCEAMAIYWYYPSKEALLDAVVDQLMAGIGVVVAGDAPEDWVAALRGVAHAYRGIAHAHPTAFPLLATRRFASAGSYAFLEKLFELARVQGVDDRTTARFFRVVSSYCSGFALNELAPPAGPLAPSARALRKQFARVAAVSTWLEPRYLDEIFSFGLELQLDALVRATRPGTPP